MIICDDDDDDEFRYNNASTHEGCLRQNGILTWFCIETATMLSGCIFLYHCTSKSLQAQ